MLSAQIYRLLCPPPILLHREDVYNAEIFWAQNQNVPEKQEPSEVYPFPSVSLLSAKMLFFHHSLHNQQQKNKYT